MKTLAALLILSGLFSGACATLDRPSPDQFSNDPCQSKVQAISGGKPFQTGEALWSGLRARYPDLAKEELQSVQANTVQVSTASAPGTGAFTLTRVGDTLVQVRQGMDWSCEFNSASVSAVSCKCLPGL